MITSNVPTSVFAQDAFEAQRRELAVVVGDDDDARERAPRRQRGVDAAIPVLPGVFGGERPAAGLTHLVPLAKRAIERGEELVVIRRDIEVSGIRQHLRSATDTTGFPALKYS